MSDTGSWYDAIRGGEAYQWRYCSCDDWDADHPLDIPPGRHIRERVPGTPVEICYAVNRTTQVITVLKIRTMDDR